MTVGVYTFELHLPQARSLKQKRQVFRRLKDRMRSRHNVAVIEMEEHADLWQRGALAVVSIAGRREVLEQLFEAIHREALSDVPGSVIETGRDYFEAADGGMAGWSEDWE